LIRKILITGTRTHRLKRHVTPIVYSDLMSISNNFDPHPASAELAYLGLGELHERLFSGQLTSVELVEALIERARVINDDTGIGLHALIEIAPDVFEQAKARDAERSTLTVRSPLHGIPVAIKDNISVKGWPSAAGSHNFTGVANEDAEVVATLRSAGAIIFASANLTEWAAGAHENIPEGWSSRGGLTKNPWWLDRSAGESSSGSAAAVAAGLVPVALGTETIGSLTMPASQCGVVGLKATRHAVSTNGVVPFSKNQDVIGVLARSVHDAATVLGELGAHFPTTETELSVVFCSDSDFGFRGRGPELVSALNSLERSLHDVVNTLPGVVPNTSDENWSRAFQVLDEEMHTDLSSYLKSRPDSIHSTLPEFKNGLPGQVQVADEEPDYAKFLSEWGGPLDTRPEIESLFLKEVRNTLGNTTMMAAVAYGPATKNDAVYLTGAGMNQYRSGLDGVSSFIGWPTVTLPLITIKGLPVGLILMSPPEKVGDLVAMGERIEKLLNPLGQFQRPTFIEATGI
jgi:amidase